MRKHERVAVYMGNRKYYKMMLLASKSLLFHTAVDRIVFLTEDDAFPVDLPPVYRCVNVSGQRYFDPHGPNVNGYYTYMTLMRAALSKLFPEYDRVLLLDPDTVVSGSLDELWGTDLGGYYYAAVRETRNNNHTKVPYFNAGVMLCNLAALRDGTDDRIIHEINTVGYEYLEQDVINFLCDGRIRELPAEYNASHCTGPSDTERIHHYVSYSKHMFLPAADRYDRMTFEEIFRSRKDGD